MTGRTLREYQREAVAYLHNAWAAGIVRPPAVLATGLGKTEIFTDPTLLNETLDAGKRVLIIAHTAHTYDTIRVCDGGMIKKSSFDSLTRSGHPTIASAGHGWVPIWPTGMDHSASVARRNTHTASR